MEHLALVLEDSPSSEDLDFLETQINEHNILKTGKRDFRPLAIFIKNEDKQIIAGLSGYTWAGFCEIPFLWVHETLRGRGYGKQLLSAAEKEAKARGCSLVVLNSYSFQAPDFYRQLGYEEIGHIKDCPPDGANYYFKKDLNLAE
jgi:ribosomal protein S18 acetylase RimI-like enzyme